MSYNVIIIINYFLLYIVWRILVKDNLQANERIRIREVRLITDSVERLLVTWAYG